MKFIPFVQIWFSFSQVPHPMTLFLSEPCFFQKWLGGIRICWWILLRKSGETVVIAGPVFVHLLNLITFLVTFQLVKPLKDFSQPFDQVAPQVFVGRRLGSSGGPCKCNNIELVQFKGVRHFSLYLFQVHYTGTVGGYIFFSSIGTISFLSFFKHLSILEARAARNSYGVSTAVLQAGNNDYFDLNPLHHYFFLEG